MSINHQSDPSHPPSQPLYPASLSSSSNGKISPHNQPRSVSDQSQFSQASNQHLNGQFEGHIQRTPAEYHPQYLARPYPSLEVPVDRSYFPLTPTSGSSTAIQTPSNIMVYPPPPPNQKQEVSPLSQNLPFDNSPQHSGERSGSIQLPSVGSWAPPTHPPPDSSHSPPRFPAHDSLPFPHNMNHKRPPSDDEEVEAGLALAGMAMVKKEPTQPAKKVKKDEGKKGEKDNKKSCSECRRLKAKCDRVFPCSNCRRRGCALVCPDGDLSCMQGKRLVLASTEQLHERIAQLEAALSQSHSKTNSTLHPLLAPQYLDGGFVNNPPPPIDQTLQSLKPSSSPPTLVQPISTAEHSPKGRSSVSSFTLLTPSLPTENGAPQDRMAVESLLLDGEKAATEGKREDEWVGENAAPAMIVGNVGQNPSSDAAEHQKVVDRLRKILRILPSREETRRRADSFWVGSQWYNSMLKREEFESIYEPAVYSPTPSNPLSPHKLACVLMVLALDCYFDLDLEEDNPIVGEYWEGAQQCFDTRFGWAASVAGVQAAALATLFVGFGWRGARASNFYWLRHMTSAAQQLGLHKDPHQSLPEDERDFRRRVFWDCYTIDCLMSINHGQRSAIPLENIETRMPMNSATLMHKLKYEYMRTVKTSVIDIGCRPDNAPASWEQILATHNTLMQYDIEPCGTMHCPILTTKEIPPLANPTNLDVPALVRSTTSMCHYKAMMFLYRPSLRRLIARLRTQPREKVVFSSEDRQTVSMTYTACHAVTRTSLYMARTHPRLSARCWAVWVQTFSAAVSMAALAIWCGPHLEANFIKSAYDELSVACDMIRENGSKRSQGVLSLLPVLQSLVHNRYPQVIGRDRSTAKISVEGEDMLFALLGGQVDQKGVSPTQGNLMNPPLQFTNSQAPPQSLAAPQQPNQRHVSSSISPIVPSQSQKPIPANLPQQQTYMPLGYDPTIWNAHMMALPVVAPLPSASAADPYHIAYNAQTSGQRPSRSSVDSATNQFPQMGFDGQSGEISNEDLWARLQTFYEPTPAYWGQSVQGVQPGYQVDYSGMAMGM